MTIAKPHVRPAVPHFSSGPCAKRPGWTLQALTDAALGRSHRAKLGRAKLKRAIDLTREVLQVPPEHHIGIVPASDTGAVEMALWSLLGARPVTVLAWESFGEGWVADIMKELKLKHVAVLKAGYGELPDLSQVDSAFNAFGSWAISSAKVSGNSPATARDDEASRRSVESRCDFRKSSRAVVVSGKGEGAGRS